MSQEFISIVISFVIGALVGAAACWFTLAKNSAQRKLQDELTSSKRKLADTYRAMDDFFKNSSLLLTQLDRHYHNFSDFMRDASNKFSIKDTEAYIDENMIADSSDESEADGTDHESLSAGSAPVVEIRHEADSSADPMPEEPAEEPADAEDQPETAEDSDRQSAEPAEEPQDPQSTDAAADKASADEAAGIEDETVPQTQPEEEQVALPELTETTDFVSEQRDPGVPAQSASGSAEPQERPEKI